ncbi:hypothetical protein B0I28_1027 [Glycomyces artemisiae]|uniref:Uncharacterized protein n=1 Tax=Glycomyces artemisiae TaxID=1076443 RepID=A0A2T0UR74_9ACTN|nr:hypothetical protein B0I28_1027 [Glycomyces artemisiae]
MSRRLPVRLTKRRRKRPRLTALRRCRIGQSASGR